MEETSTIYSLERVKELEQPQTGYSAKDVKAAREAWLDARTAASQAAADLSNVQLQYSRLATRGRVQQVERASLELANAREQEQELEEVFHTVLAQAGHLEALQAGKDQIAQMQKDEATLAAARAAEAMEAYRHEIQPLYIFNGGQLADFERIFPSLWEEELRRRTLSGSDMLKEKMQSGGHYPTF